MSTGKEHVLQTEAQREQLRRLEEERRREACAGFEAQISAQLAQYNVLQQQLDEAKQKLPDLAYQLPAMLAFGGNKLVPAELQRYSNELTQQINIATSEMHSAIRTAEAVLAERLALASAWIELKSLQHTAIAQGQILVSLASKLPNNTKLPQVNTPALPSDGANSTEVKTAVAAYQQLIQQQNQRHTQLVHTIQTQQEVLKAAGERVQTQYAAQSRLTDYEKALQNEKQQQARQQLQQKLRQINMSETLLPVHLQTMITTTLNLAHLLPDAGGLLSRLLEQYHGLCMESQKAKTMLQKPPLQLQDVPHLQVRWQQLAAQLQGVANGQQSFLSHFDHAYQQLRCDEQKVIRDRAAMYVVASSAQKAGLALDATRDGGWMLHDPRDQNWHASATTSAHPQGVHIHYDLNIDPQANAIQEQLATANFCGKLRKMQAAAQNTRSATVNNKVAESHDAPPKPRRNRKPMVDKKKAAAVPLQ